MIPLAFDRSLERFSEATALLPDNGAALSYGELFARVGRLAKQFSADRELLFILCGQNSETVTGYLAALRANQATALLDGDLDPAVLEHLVQKYCPEWIFEPLAPEMEYLYRLGNYGLRRTSHCGGENTAIHPDLALLLSTSGTTGSPKMVRLSKNNLHANAASIVQYLGITGRDRAITTLPLHYSYGLSILNSHLAAGAGIVLTDSSIMTRSFWELFKNHQVSSLAGVPYHYEMLLRLRFFDMDLPHLKTLTQAGGRLKPDLVRRFADHARQSDRRFFVMYGQTEAGPRISFVPPELVAAHPDAIGIAIPGGRLWLEDENGKVIDQENREGELVYQGPNVMMGYARCREDLAAGDELGGILHTGDLALRSSNGLYAITGRRKRIIKLFGNRINLDEVEQLLQHQGFDAVCGGRDNSLLVLLTDKGMEAAAKKSLVTALGVHHSAISVQTVSGFQRTGSGKIDYQKTFAALDEQ